MGVSRLRTKFKSVILINIILLSILIGSYNLDYTSSNSEHQSNYDSNDKSIYYLTRRDPSREPFEILSEPIYGLNFNTGSSDSPKIAAEGDKIYVVWKDSNDTNGCGSDGEIFFRYFDGMTWSKTQVISEPILGLDINKGDCGYPDIAVENGSIYVSWNDNSNLFGSGSDWDIFYRTNLTGSGWDPIQVISEPYVGIYGNNNTEDSYGLSIGVENGKVYIAWADENNTNGCGGGFWDTEIFYRCNLTGTGWEDTQVISETVVGQDINTKWSDLPDLAIENGSIYVVWMDQNDTKHAGGDWDIFLRCNLNGTGWGDTEVISEPYLFGNENKGDSFEPKIAVENNNTYVVWMDWHISHLGSDLDVFYRYKPSNASWQEIQIISEPVVRKNSNTGQGWFKGIAVENGIVFVVWDDDNNTDGSHQKGGFLHTDIHFRCNHSGLGWGIIQTISEPIFGSDINTGRSDHSEIAVSGGKIHVVWQDDNDTNYGGDDLDIFYRQVPPLILRLPGVLPSTGNSSTYFNFSISYINNFNIKPTEIYVNISGVNFPMIELNPVDQNYLNGKKYYFNITHLGVGEHTYHFWASDGKNISKFQVSDKLTVNNTSPTILTTNNITTFEDIYYEVKYECDDIDVENLNQPIFWNLSTDANWLKINSTTGVLNGTPTNDDVGEYWVEIVINDTIANDTSDFILSVIEVNDHPIIETENVKITNEDEFYRVDYNASDIDSPLEDQKWSLQTNTSSWLKINSNTGVLFGTPSNEHVGEFWINVSVDDKEGGIDFTNFSLSIININDHPVITTKEITVAIADELYEVHYNATDVDSPKSEQIWSMQTSAKGWLKIDSKTGVLNGTPSLADIGSHEVNVSLVDGDGGFDWQIFNLSVHQRNLPPEIITPDNSTAFVNMSYLTDYEATDDETPVNKLRWSFKTNANWLKFHETTAIIYGTPNKKDIGNYWVNISVRDHENSLTFHNFTLTIKELTKPPEKPPVIVEINNPPELSNQRMEPSSGDTETNFVFSIHYYDLENDPPAFIQVVIDGGNYSMSLFPSENSTNGIYVYTTKLTVGQHKCYFIASDGLNITRLDEFTTQNIVKVSPGSDRESGWQNMIWFILLFIIILLLIGALVVNKKRKRKETLVEDRVRAPLSLMGDSIESKPVQPLPLAQPKPSVPAATEKPIEPIQPKITTPTEIRLIGRDNELQQLLAYLNQAVQGQGKTVFISGEAGIGKTRLVNELKMIAQNKGFNLLSGNSVYESLTPYIPFQEALKSGGLEYLFGEETPRIEAIYLITYDGLLINESVRKETKLDPDIFSSMLFTVSNFINESLSKLLGSEKEGTLNTLGYENYRIIIESGKSANLAVIITGKETEFLINDMRGLFQKVNENYSNVLTAWDGDEEKVKGIDKILGTLIASGKYNGIYYKSKDPKAKRDLLFKNVSLGLNRFTKTKPALLCIEDLQWADPSSLAMMQHIARNTKNSKLLIIGTYRPEETTAVDGKTHPLMDTLRLMDREDLYEQLRLQRLPEESINEFLTSQLGKNEFVDDFKDRIYRETEGNPLFIIQLIKFLVEENIVIEDSEGVWKLDKDLEEINIPTKIYNVIARRLDRLEKDDRQVLDYASVIGPTFKSAVLTSILGIERIQLLEQLRSLEKTHKLIYSYDGNFKFDHDKIKEVLYNEIPPELRMEYHSIIANTIETQNKDNLDEVVGELAFHYYHCKNKDKALSYLTKAAEGAKKNYSNEESIRYYNQMLDLEQEPNKRIQILESLGDIYYLIRNYDLSIDSYNSALVSTEGKKKAEMMAKIGGILERKGEYDNSLEICTGALELVKGTWTSEEALALQNIGNVHLYRKNYNQALEQYERSLEIRQKINDEPGIGACLNNIALVHYGKEEYDSALEHLEKSLEIAKKLGDQESIASTLNNIGAIFHMRGDLAKAKIYYDMSKNIRAKIGAYLELTTSTPQLGATQIIRGGFRAP